MLEVNICVGSSCHLKGSYNVIQSFQQIIEEKSLHDLVEMKSQFCMKQCQRGVSVSIKGEVLSVSPETARAFFMEKILPEVKPLESGE